MRDPQLEAQHPGAFLLDYPGPDICSAALDLLATCRPPQDPERRKVYERARRELHRHFRKLDAWEASRKEAQEAKRAAVQHSMDLIRNIGTPAPAPSMDSYWP